MSAIGDAIDDLTALSWIVLWRTARSIEHGRDLVDVDAVLEDAKIVIDHREDRADQGGFRRRHDEVDDRRDNGIADDEIDDAERDDTHDEDDDEIEKADKEDRPAMAFRERPAARQAGEDAAAFDQADRNADAEHEAEKNARYDDQYQADLDDQSGEQRDENDRRQPGHHFSQ